MVLGVMGKVESEGSDWISEAISRIGVCDATPAVARRQEETKWGGRRWWGMVRNAE